MLELLWLTDLIFLRSQLNSPHAFDIPRVTEGYRNVRAPPSVCLSICLSAVLFRLYLDDYSLDRVQILYGDSAYSYYIAEIKNYQSYRILQIYEDLVHIRRNVHVCSGCFSKTIYRIVFKFM